MLNLVRYRNILFPTRRHIFKFRYSQNSQTSVRKPNFFRRQAIVKFLYFLHFTYILETPCRIRFDLDNSLNDEKYFFLNFVNRKTRKIRYENITYLKASYSEKFICPKLYLHMRYSIPSLLRFVHILVPIKILFLKFVIQILLSYFFFMQSLAKLPFALRSIFNGILHTDFGSNWTTSCPDEDLFFKFRYSQNSHISVQKPNFFCMQAIAKDFFPTFYLHGGTPC